MGLKLQISQPSLSWKSGPISDSLLLALAIFVACQIGIQSRLIFTLASVWPANALFLAFVVVRPHRVNVFTWIFAGLAYLAGDLVNGSTLERAALLGSANLVSVAGGAVAARLLFRREINFASPEDTVKVILVMGCAALSGGLAGAVIGPIALEMTAANGFKFWLAAEFCNYAIFLPLITAGSFGNARRWRFFSSSARQRFHQYAALTTVIALLVAVFTVGGPGAPTYVIPGLLWCAIVYRPFAAASIAGVTCVLVLIAAPMGALPLGYDLSTPAAATSFRLSIGMIAVGSMAVGTMNAAWRSAHSKLEYLASHDSLTGLLNRGGFIEQLDMRLEDKRPFNLLMVDVDHFKAINDTFGHGVGDDVLSGLAALLRGTGPEDNIAGRIGGEEFAVIVDGPVEAGLRYAEMLRAQTAEAVSTDYLGKPVGVTISVGVTASDRASSMAEMLHAADTALYEAKRGGRNRVSPSTSTKILSSL